MLLDRSLGEPELTGDAGVRAALGHQRQHLAFACREDRERVVASSNLDQCLHETRVDDRSARRDPPQRLDELVDVEDAALEQVADPLARSRGAPPPARSRRVPRGRGCRSRGTPRGSCAPPRALRSSAWAASGCRRSPARARARARARPARPRCPPGRRPGSRIARAGSRALRGEGRRRRPRRRDCGWSPRASTIVSTLRRCPVAGTERPPPSGCEEAHWSAVGARPVDAIFVAQQRLPHCEGISRCSKP